MGTHPIFESDFDCLTDCDWLSVTGQSKASGGAREQESIRNGRGYFQNHK